MRRAGHTTAFGLAYDDGMLPSKQLSRAGRRAGAEPSEESPQARLIACHGRIRAFLGACAEMSAEGADQAKVRESAEVVARYFSEAFVLHVEDEERSVLPRLGADADWASRVHEEHARDADLVAKLVAICRELCDVAPEPSARTRLGRLTASLAPRIHAHLELEERTMLPQLAELPAETLAQILQEMEARRRVQDGRG